MIPWSDPYRAIVGGGVWIGVSYINVGQDTLYLQKFNVRNTKYSLYSHQYMANIMAPYSESTRIANAYRDYQLGSQPMTFIIPVYTGMPAAAAPVLCPAAPGICAGGVPGRGALGFHHRDQRQRLPRFQPFDDCPIDRPHTGHPFKIRKSPGFRRGRTHL